MKKSILALLCICSVYAYADTPQPVSGHSKCMFSYDMDDTVDHNHGMTPGFIASAQIAAEHGCALIMNSDQGIPTQAQYHDWNPGPQVLTYPTTSLPNYLFGGDASKATAQNDITYGSVKQYSCDPSAGGDSIKNCRILKMKSVFGANKMPNNCVFHFDDNASEAYHAYRGYWSGAANLGANPIYVGDLDQYYTVQKNPQPKVSGNEIWYTGSVASVKVKLEALLGSALQHCSG